MQDFRLLADSFTWLTALAVQVADGTDEAAQAVLCCVACVALAAAAGKALSDYGSC